MAFSLAVVLIFLVLAAQFNSFRDPFVILAGSVPLAMFGALIFAFLKMPDPSVHFWTDGWTTTLNIFSQVGLVTLVGLVSRNAGGSERAWRHYLQTPVYLLITNHSSLRLRPRRAAPGSLQQVLSFVVHCSININARNAINSSKGSMIGKRRREYAVQDLRKK